MKPREAGTYVQIRLADAAPAFTEAAIDLLAAAENADEVLVTDEIREAAARMRKIIDGGRW